MCNLLEFFDGRKYEATFAKGPLPASHGESKEDIPTLKERSVA